MLAQNFLPPNILGIPHAGQAALIKVLGMLERGELHHCRRGDDIKPFGFNLANHRVELACGTVACIAGWADIAARPGRLNLLRLAADRPALAELFAPKDISWHAVTPAQAAAALRNYLTLGAPRWDDVLAMADDAGTVLPESDKPPAKSDGDEQRRPVRAIRTWSDWNSLVATDERVNELADLPAC